MYLSGSSFFTLGSASPHRGIEKDPTIAAGGIGISFLALVISYLPVMYQSFSRREAVISLLDARGGSPAAAVELLRRYGHGNGLESLPELLRTWEQWAAECWKATYPFRCWSTFARSTIISRGWPRCTTIMDTCALVIHGIGGAAGWQAQLTFAMARHAAVDLAQILSSAPRPPDADRLPPPILRSCKRPWRKRESI